MKKIFLIGLILLVCFGLYMYFAFNPLIIERKDYNQIMYADITNYNEYYRGSFLPRDTFKLFQHLNFDDGIWRVCILMKEHYDVCNNIPRGKYLETTDIELIKELRDMVFEYTGGEVVS